MTIPMKVDEKLGSKRKITIPANNNTSREGIYNSIALCLRLRSYQLNRPGSENASDSMNGRVQENQESSSPEFRE